ncbi:T-lymphoma invasion and metastasis-inducing protein 2 isoform X2 [Austrofundulus limnaeus]|uniref:T-lymphoma invasion and metastasis-inducing protein 2 isoform X2 n=1 Tax=Austrofundulus limnaeus TaxID=52670 RepID=A0A2I4CPJ2_AUSLI|nr:PREDICTED: T-lymphoma invasion and metastasis-inducing protein 2-like isoform X2 [Austrofundulus limnaeus]
MGNTDSTSTFVPPVKPSFGFSKKEEVLSARSWWRSNTKSRGRSYLSQPASWRYESGQGSSKLSYGSPQRFSRSPLGFQGSDGERTSLESGGSPKVQLRKDGSMRVEFTNARVAPAEPQGAPPGTGAAPEPSLRTSKGSSLSSENSWYDSPWGGEQTDSVFICGRSLDNSSGYNTFSSAQAEDISPGFSSAHLFQTVGHNSCSSGRTDDSGIGDSLILQQDSRDLRPVPPSGFYSRHNMPPAFPPPSETITTESNSFSTAFETCFQEQRENSTSSFSSTLDDVMATVRDVEPQYCTSTLPCRKLEPGSSASSGNRKDFLKSRIQQLSDWTGSLSRKKRKIQEPNGADASDVFINGATGTVLWSSNPLHHQNQNLVPLTQCCNAQRQDVYQNFMQELAAGCSSADHRTDPSEEEEEEEDDVEEEKRGGEVLVDEEQAVVRRAGWLSFKALLTINKDRKLQLVSCRRWRRYWVTLKGCSLMFYEEFGRSGGELESPPRFVLLAEDSVVQAVPEHPRREHVFCLSNSYGDVYLLQASSQTDLENWVTAVHSASAALLARREGNQDTLQLLRRRIRSLLQRVDTDGKMKKMAELQLSIIKEQKNRRAVENQIQQWEQNLEKLNLDLFRLRCYLSSLQGGEQPNPKSLLAVASRTSKTTLGRLGVFSVSSFHALVCSREEDQLKRRCLSQSAGSVKRGLLSSLKVQNRRNKHSQVQDCESVAPSAGPARKLQLGEEQKSSSLGVFTLQVCRHETDQNFGFAVTGHVDGVGQSHVFVSEVDPFGPSAIEGLRAGDEVLAVNGSPVSGLDLDLLQTLFTHHNLQLLLRRDESPDPEEPTLVWPNPADPGDPAHLLTWSTDSALVTDAAEAPPPAVSHTQTMQRSPEQNLDQVFPLYQTFAETRTSDHEIPTNPYCREGGLPLTSPAHLSVCQRLRKVIEELVDTEKSYVKDLVCLFDIYLSPLQNQTFLSKDEMEALFGSLPEMLDFQRVFLQTLEERISACPNFSCLETPEQFQNLLFSLGGSFLYYADHFKLYSGFCANHIKVQKVLERAKTDGAFKHFLETRNPTNQHSSSLESYLIKPVQRVLKYPLLLRELVSLTDPESLEHTHLREALRAMEKVATHINEMQKIYEDYGCVFDQLVAEQSGADKQVTEISMGEFLVHSSVVWLNPLPSLRRLRKEPQLTLFVFKRAVILVYRENHKQKKRMTNSRSADLDPFRFRWLIPVSALQIRSANIPGSGDPCVWELVHRKSEVEGRPETVFQLCSSGLETKAGVLRVLSSLLRDRAPGASLRRSKLSKTERSSSWRRRQHRGRSDLQRTHPTPTERSRRPDGVLNETCSEPLLPSHAPSDSSASGRRTRLCSLTGELEAQLQRLNFAEEDEEERRSSSLRRSPAGDGLDFSFLEKDFSLQSLKSVVNEDCFYDSVLRSQTAEKANMLTC